MIPRVKRDSGKPGGYRREVAGAVFWRTPVGFARWKQMVQQDRGEQEAVRAGTG